MMTIRPTKSTDFEVFTPAHHDILEAKAAGIEPSFPDASECVTLSLYGFPLAIGGNCGDQCWFVTSDQVWRLSGKSHRTKSLAVLCVTKQKSTVFLYLLLAQPNHNMMQGFA